jgi:hypothetical protein
MRERRAVTRAAFRPLARIAPLACAAAAIASCRFDQAALSSARPAEETIGAVTATPQATILAVGASQHIGVSAVSLTGAPVTTFDSVTYQLNSIGDTAIVSLSSAGVVTALKPSVATVKVNVFVTQSGVTKGDQTLVQVTQAALAHPRLTFVVGAFDSTRIAFGSSKTVTQVVQDTVTGALIATPAVRLAVKADDAPRLTVYAPSLSFGNAPITVTAASAPSDNQIYANDQKGVVWLYGSTLAYGKPLRDSILFTLLYPIRGTISVGAAGLGLTSPYQDQLIYLSAGAIVSFSNGTPLADSIGIAFTFDVPARANPLPPPGSPFGGDSGNITPLFGGQTAFRVFQVCSVCPAETVAWKATAVSGVPPWKGQGLQGSIYIPP